MMDTDKVNHSGLPADTRQAHQRIQNAAATCGRTIRFMELSGSHTLNAFRSGLHGLLPENVKLISGPGCSVCALPQQEVDQFTKLALREDLVLCGCPDLVRVLSQAGAPDISTRMIYSPLEAVQMARNEPDRQFVLGAVGFDISAAGTAGAIEEADKHFLSNFTVLARHRRLVPVVHELVSRIDPPIDGFICPANVAMITGADAFAAVASVQGRSCVISGFEPEQMLMAVARLVEMAASGHPGLENLSAGTVTPHGDRFARQVLESIFEGTDAYWRGLGDVAGSGLKIRRRYSRYDAQIRYELESVVPQEVKTGGLCAKVVNGAAESWECPLFGTKCTTQHPVGPAMATSNGTCHIRSKYGYVTPPAGNSGNSFGSLNS